MTVGELRERVTFYRPTPTTDSLRGQTVAYTTVVCTVWASWRGLTTRESLQAQALQTFPLYRLTIRWRDDILTTLRVRKGAGGPWCSVVSVNDPTGRREWLDLDVVEVPA